MQISDIIPIHRTTALIALDLQRVKREHICIYTIDTGQNVIQQIATISADDDYTNSEAIAATLDPATYPTEMQPYTHIALSIARSDAASFMLLFSGSPPCQR